jgi:hypothetical protein
MVIAVQISGESLIADEGGQGIAMAKIEHVIVLAPENRS